MEHHSAFYQGKPAICSDTTNLEDMLSETGQRKILHDATHRCNLSKSKSVKQEQSHGVGQGMEGQRLEG